MNKRVYYSWEDVEHMLATINNEMAADGWRPDYIVGMTRGGLVPAVMLSNLTGIKMHALGKDDTNAWMSEDAVGWEDTTNDGDAIVPDVNHPNNRSNILVIDDINHSGKSFNWLKSDWKSTSAQPDFAWDDIWHGNVRFASLVDNEASLFTDVDYAAIEMNKIDKPVWCVFPWEAERDYGNL